MTPDQKGSLPIRVEKLFYDLQDRVFSDVVRRIKKTGEITSTADYQINKLLILGNSTEFIESELERLLDATDPEIWELYDKVANWEYVRYRDAYEQIMVISFRYLRMSRFSNGHRQLLNRRRAR